MAGNYRYWCGECDYRTPWLSESNGAGQQEEHYARRHPGIVPGGQVESERKKREGGGCVLVVAALFLVLLLASTCVHKPGNSSMPPAPGESTVDTSGGARDPQPGIPDPWTNAPLPPTAPCCDSGGMTKKMWTSAALPDLAGRTVVVTGASSGLGATTARSLAEAGAHVVLAVRDPAKGTEVAASIDGSTEVRQLDLSVLASVRAFAEAWTGDLDVLVNNAGVMAVPEGRTADGFETHIGTNHLGPFALTALLLPHVTGRVVTVASGLAGIGRIDLGDLNGDHRAYKPLRAYGQSKLANLLFTTELHRRLTEAGSKVRAVAAHPGVAVTSLDRHMTGPAAVAARLSYRFTAQKDPRYGAYPTLFAATQDLPGDSYVGPGGRSGEWPKLEKRSAASQDADLARRLWALSARLTSTDWPPAGS